MNARDRKSLEGCIQSIRHTLHSPVKRSYSEVNASGSAHHKQLVSIEQLADFEILVTAILTLYQTAISQVSQYSASVVYGDIGKSRGFAAFGTIEVPHHYPSL